MGTPASNPNEFLLDDPNDKKRKGFIDAVIVVASGLHDGKADGGTLWKTKAKDLTRGDSWALAGFGNTNAFDTWTIEEMNKLATAFELHMGRKYGAQKYICCSSAAHEK